MSEPAAPDIVERLRDEADLCRNETADDVARLLDQAADEIERLRRVNEGLHSAIAVLGMRIKSAADETTAALSKPQCPECGDSGIVRDTETNMGGPCPACQVTDAPTK